MLVKYWMTENVITLDEEEPISRAVQIMKEFKIRRIPITKDGKLTGMLTINDVKEAVPSKVLGIDLKELYELFLSLKVRDVMTPDPITVSPEDTVEKASILMLENKISGLPVVNQENYVIGIITQTDLFKLFVNLTGAYFSPYHIAVYIDNIEEVSNILSIFKNLNAQVFSFLCWKCDFCGDDPYKRRLFIRFHMDEEAIKRLLSQIKGRYEIAEFKRENLSEISRKRLKEREFILL